MVECEHRQILALNVIDSAKQQHLYVGDFAFTCVQWEEAAMHRPPLFTVYGLNNSKDAIFHYGSKLTVEIMTLKS